MDRFPIFAYTASGRANESGGGRHLAAADVTPASTAGSQTQQTGATRPIH